MKKTILISTLLIFAFGVNAQSELDSLLLEVSCNNKSIRAYKQLLVAKKINFKTGLSLNNPTLEYDYMRGAPGSAGNQTDITAVQNFDFPSVYLRKNQLSKLSIEKLAVLQKDFIQEVLLETKLIYIELIFLQKSKTLLATRIANEQKIREAIQQKFDTGSSSILELNRAKVNSVSSKRKLNDIDRKLKLTHQNLALLNGGIEYKFSAYSYTITPKLGSLEEVMAKAIRGDYHLQVIRQDQLITEKQVQVNKALAMPKLEGGYRYQSILGQRFNGFHAGISIPLFENKYKVKAAKQQVKYFEFLAENHQVAHHLELETLYGTATSLKENIDSYLDLFSSTQSEELLLKAFEVGEISSLNYFMELNYFYQARNDYILLQKEYNIIVCKLMKYQL
jgi:cobalt-zinc-cadmium efflux system outer membrane protein